MSLTLLLDLDDTLLVNDIDDFLPQYLAAFSKQVAPYVDPHRFVEALLAGTRAMVANRRPDCTLKEVFEEIFYSQLSLEPGTFQAVADHFYSQVFPTLRDLTHPRPEAVRLVEEAKARQYKLVIATNPLFPSTAILQRLAWAGLPVDKFDFELVSSYESFHYAKPDPAFFAETMARIGWPRGPVVVVGDDLERDIIASHRLGLETYWLPPDGAQPQEQPQDELIAPSASGELQDVLRWIDQVPAEDLAPDYTTKSAMIAILRATPAALDSMCRDLPAEISAQRPGADEWCASEILCHLRDVDQEVNLSRIQMVLKEENPFISGVDTDPWAEERGYILQDGAQALFHFIHARMRLVEILESLQPGDWNRQCRHAIFGPTHLHELVNIIAMHDRLHIRQLREVLKSVTGN